VGCVCWVDKNGTGVREYSLVDVRVPYEDLVYKVSDLLLGHLERCAHGVGHDDLTVEAETEKENRAPKDDGDLVILPALGIHRVVESNDMWNSKFMVEELTQLLGVWLRDDAHFNALFSEVASDLFLQFCEREEIGLTVSRLTHEAFGSDDVA
jgi:hypothetical protein